MPGMNGMVGAAALFCCAPSEFTCRTHSVNTGPLIFWITGTVMAQGEQHRTFLHKLRGKKNPRKRFDDEMNTSIFAGRKDLIKHAAISWTPPLDSVVSIVQDWYD